MLCVNPFKRPGREFGCGQCICCRINRKRLWTGRIQLESLAYRESSFVTLTYSDENVPVGNTLSKAHWREFTKGIGYRYFGCGEYGDKTGRPHYHFILFGLPPLEAEDFARSRWPYGFVSARPFVAEHAGYIASYTVKRLRSSDDPRLAEGQLPEFASMSKRPGVGVRGVSWLRNWLDTEKGWSFMGESRDVPSTVKIGQKHYPLGRTVRAYLRRELGIYSDDPVRNEVRRLRVLAEQEDSEFQRVKSRRRDVHYQAARHRALRGRGVI